MAGLLFESLDRRVCFVVQPGWEVVVGRRPPPADHNVRVQSLLVSSSHLRIVGDPLGCTIEDAGSTSGVYLDDLRLTGATRVEPGARIRMGGVVLGLRRVQGELARDLLRGEPRTHAFALALARGVLEALLALHRDDLVHADVTPNTILCSETGEVVLLTQGWSSLSRIEDGEDAIEGNPLYVAPERFGEGRLQPASDVYSLALIVFEALAARQPFGCMTVVDSMMAKLRGPAPACEPGWPPALAAWLTASLNPDPRMRPSASEGLLALRG
ncbi:protein kinase domain-containing protein [Nannocystaceae bacterium ST9]